MAGAEDGQPGNGLEDSIRLGSALLGSGVAIWCFGFVLHVSSSGLSVLT